MRRQDLICLLVLLGSFVLAPIGAVGEPGSDRAAFAVVHRDLADRLASSAFGTPLVVEARVEDKAVEGEVDSILDHPIELLREVLTDPVALCDVLTLHFNIKSCHPDESPRADSVHVPLRIETGRKYYVPPQGRNPVTYRLDRSQHGSGFVRAELTTERGPFGVRDMRIEIRAMGLEEGTSFVQVRYSYAPGLLARVATRTFLATLARNKIGFTVTGTTPEGEPIYVKGAQAAVERNALRYHLALVAYLQTRDVSESRRFEERVARWFDLTEQYSPQLREMPRDEYLDLKRRERLDQEVQAEARASSQRR